MSLGEEEILRVARLAELAVPEGEVEQLVSDFNRILDYVAQLDRVRTEGTAAHGGAFVAGPTRSPLRPDAVGPVPLALPPARLAPEFAEGFFLVPRRGAMDDR